MLRNFPKFSTRKILPDIIFWTTATIVMTIFYRPGLPNYFFALQLVLLVMPINILYFYIVVKVLLPQFLYKKKYWSLNLSIVATGLIAAVLFRLNEILILYPMMSETFKEAGLTLNYNIDQPFQDQFTNPIYMVNAIEQSNIIVWIGLGITFFRMWYERRQAALEAELNLLKAQIHPHFLFNTLNNLYALTLKNSPQSPSVVLRLSEILRYMLYECNTDSIELKKEISILNNYIALEKMRYDERLEVNFSHQGDFIGADIAPLLLLPLVENAFKHGASEEIQQAWINIDLTLKHNKLKFKVSNSIPDKDILAKEGAKTNDQAKGIGISNIQKRLEILYPTAHKFQVFVEEDVFLAVMEVDLTKRVTI